MKKEKNIKGIDLKTETTKVVGVDAIVIPQPNTFLNADCMDYLPKCPAGYFDLAIVDPPYGIGEEGGRNRADRPTKKWKNPNSQIYKPFDDSQPPGREYFEQLKRVSKNQIIFGGNYFTNYLEPKSGWILWDKKVSEGEYLSNFEMAWTSFDRRAMKFEYLWAGFKKAEQIKRIHPTEKPVALYRWILRNYAAGGLILDTHVGSGSSLQACIELGFKYVGFEIDEDYYKDADKRVRRAFRKFELEFDNDEAAE